MILLKEECLEGSRGRRKRRKEVNPCKDQGGEELVAVLRIAVLFLIFLWKTESKREVEVCECVFRLVL